ncbi:hypothetical protein bsdcttw_19330 [Anaerocolumna chitinilytica]|uniref:Uncharacterized protein n=1 Tax=Anaerocolumna chitinilytica TaxID=1727145 RepID=A0A7I8DKN9_9FIRM|nr:hypothetical protein bsdcttw_19330 [Anaerocolumna chitinilytica]
MRGCPERLLVSGQPLFIKKGCCYFSLILMGCGCFIINIIMFKILHIFRLIIFTLYKFIILFYNGVDIQNKKYLMPDIPNEMVKYLHGNLEKPSIHSNFRKYYRSL